MATQTIERPVERPAVDLEALFPGRYLSVTSFKRDGRGIATPVWFVSDGSRLFAFTDLHSPKVWRIRRNPQVLVAPCRVNGKLRREAVWARAEVLTEAADLDRVHDLLVERYKVSYRLVMFAYRLGRRLRGRPSVADGAVLAITVEESGMNGRPSERVAGAEGKAHLPPRWFVQTFWHLHRRVVRASRGRRGLWRPRPGKWGALRLTTTGRRSGDPRSVIIGYYEDGPNLVSMAMNGWGAAEPAWWLNLQADPQAVVELAGDVRRDVVARPAVGAERDRLWQRWRDLDKNLDSYAARRPQETAVVVLEPRARGG
jgi:PPOX class probable F420-dependent enzyme/deazaflavin-dependent oxidoreductase (nitroreductase family)